MSVSIRVPRCARHVGAALMLGVFGLASLARTEADPPGGWQLKIQAGKARPVAADGALFLGCRDGALVALDPSSGRQRWSFQTGVGLPPDGVPVFVRSIGEAFHMGRANIGATPVVFDGTVYVSSFDGHLYALDAASGTPRWRHPISADPDEFWPNPETLGADELLISAQRLVALCHPSINLSRRLIAVDPTNGEERWRFTPPTNITEGVTDGAGLLFISTVGRDAETTRIIALNPEDGAVAWQMPIPGDAWPSPPVFSDPNVYVTTRPELDMKDGNTTLHAFDARTGEFRWRRRVAGTQEFLDGPAALGRDSVVFLLTSRELNALDARTGTPVWNLTGKQFEGNIVMDERAVYALAREDGLLALNRRNGAILWRVGLGVRGGRLDLLEGGNIFLRSARSMHAMRVSDGMKLWNCSLPSGLRRSRATIAAGRLFVTVQGPASFNVDKTPPRGSLIAIDLQTGRAK